LFLHTNSPPLQKVLIDAAGCSILSALVATSYFVSQMSLMMEVFFI
jgi:hypothetical protein